MIKARILLTLLLTCSAGQVAVSQDNLPTDAELRSAYCMPVLRWQIKEFSAAKASVDSSPQQNSPNPLEPLVGTSDALRKKIADLESALNRLELYLLPRMDRLDASALLGATARGNADVRELEAMSDRCTKQCVQPAQDGVKDEKARMCFDSCTDKDLVARLRACAAPTWLPF